MEDYWSGDKCNDACEARGGKVCGNFMMGCCQTTCEGTFVKTCAGDIVTGLDCTYRKPYTPGVTQTLLGKGMWTGNDCNDDC